MRGWFRVWCAALGVLALDWAMVQWVKSAVPNLLPWLWIVAGLGAVALVAATLVLVARRLVFELRALGWVAPKK